MRSRIPAEGPLVPARELHERVAVAKLECKDRVAKVVPIDYQTGVPKKADERGDGKGRN